MRPRRRSTRPTPSASVRVDRGRGSEVVAIAPRARSAEARGRPIPTVPSAHPQITVLDSTLIGGCEWGQGATFIGGAGTVRRRGPRGCDRATDRGTRPAVRPSPGSPQRRDTLESAGAPAARAMGRAAGGCASVACGSDPLRGAAARGDAQTPCRCPSARRDRSTARLPASARRTAPPTTPGRLRARPVTHRVRAHTTKDPSCRDSSRARASPSQRSAPPPSSSPTAAGRPSRLSSGHPQRRRPHP